MIKNLILDGSGTLADDLPSVLQGEPHVAAFPQIHPQSAAA
jgi:hypothetical protein